MGGPRPHLGLSCSAFHGPILGPHTDSSPYWAFPQIGERLGQVSRSPLLNCAVGWKVATIPALRGLQGEMLPRQEPRTQGPVGHKLGQGVPLGPSVLESCVWQFPTQEAHLKLRATGSEGGGGTARSQPPPCHSCSWSIMDPPVPAPWLSVVTPSQGKCVSRGRSMPKAGWHSRHKGKKLRPMGGRFRALCPPKASHQSLTGEPAGALPLHISLQPSQARITQRLLLYMVPVLSRQPGPGPRGPCRHQLGAVGGPSQLAARGHEDLGCGVPPPEGKPKSA